MATQEETATELLEIIGVSEECNLLWVNGVEFTRNNSGLLEVTNKIKMGP